MKNILVPTDFSLQSLSIIHDIVSKESERVKIHLFHMVLIPNDLTDLLFLRKSHLHAQVPDNFREAIQLLRNKYQKQVAKIDFSFYYGSRASVVSSIIESNNIDRVYMLANYQYKQPLPSSVNIMPLVEKCKLPVEKVNLRGKAFSQAQTGAFSALLANQYADVYFNEEMTEAVND